MSTTTDSPFRNGVDTATLFATLDAVKGNNDIAKFQFRASNKWVSGTHSQGTIKGFYGAGQEMEHKSVHVFDVEALVAAVGDQDGVARRHEGQGLADLPAGRRLRAGIVVVARRRDVVRRPSGLGGQGRGERPDRDPEDAQGIGHAGNDTPPAGSVPA